MVNYNLVDSEVMDIEDSSQFWQTNKKIRLKIVTNRGLQFITAVRSDARVSDLASRALSVYLELAGDGLAQSTRKQLTVSAVKQGVFFMPKSQCVSSLLSSDDKVEVVIVKARPKYPQQLYQLPSIGPIQAPVRPQPALAEYGVADQINEVEEQEMEPEVANESKVVVVQNHPNDAAPENEQKVLAKGTESSKRQKKKDKKKEKQCKRKEEEQEKEGKDKPVKEQPEHSHRAKQQKGNQFRDVIPESIPHKKIKGDQESRCSKGEKPIKIGQSPKITFHQDPPKMDSPKIDFSLEQTRKKGTESPLFRADFHLKKLQEKERKATAQKVVSPSFQIMKSPLSSNRTPNQGGTVLLNDPHRTKDKEQLVNFTLPRKASEDRRAETKNRKQNEQSAPLTAHRHEIKEAESSITSKIIANNQAMQVQLERGSKKQNQSQVKGGAEKKGQKQSSSLVIVEPESESDSQQSKNVANQPWVSSRAKELAEIKNKIMSFSLDSGDED